MRRQNTNSKDKRRLLTRRNSYFENWNSNIAFKQLMWLLNKSICELSKLDKLRKHFEPKDTN